MSELPAAGAKLTLDLSEWESNWSSVMGDAAELQSTIDDLGGSIDIEFNVDDSMLPFDEIPESTDTELNVTESDDAKQAVADIHFMALKDKLETIWNVAGNVWDLFTKFESIVVAPFLDIEDAVARINAQTGGTGLENLSQFIRDIQAADLGESVDDISNVVIAAKQLNAPIEEATTAALTFTHTFKDQNPVTVMTTLNTMAGEFKISMQTASDIMTVAFQQGMNKGGDLLNVVNSNASSWADMGLSSTEALSAMNSLMDNGVDSASDAAKMIQTMDDALTTAAANADSPQAEALKTLGMDNPKDSGSAMGADFIDGFAASFTNLPADKQDLVSGVLFGKGGKKFTGALEGLTTQGGPFEDVTNAAKDAATEIDNSLRGAIDDFILEVNTKIAELLSSENIDLPGKIKALKEGFQEAVDVLSKGGTVGEALEVGLNIPGLSNTLDTFIGNFQRIIGNLEIAFLQIVASIQDITGHGQQAETTRAEISRLATQQLPFDLKLANPEEVGGMIQTAVDNGVDPTKVADLLGTAISELINSGDFDKAQNLIDSAANLPADLVNNASTLGIDSAALQQQLKDAGLEIQLFDPTEFQSQLDEAKRMADTTFGPSAAPVNPLGPLTIEQGAGTGTSILTIFDDLKTKADETSTGVTTSVETMNTDVGTSLDETAAKFSDTAVAAQLMDTDIAAAMSGNTVTASFQDVADAAAENFPSVMTWFTRTANAAATFDNQVSVHLRSVIKQLNDLNFLAMVAIGNVTNAQALGGAGGGTTITNNSVVVNNNVNGQAAAIANGYSIAASLRPGGAR